MQRFGDGYNYPVFASPCPIIALIDLHLCKNRFEFDLSLTNLLKCIPGVDLGTLRDVA